MGYFWIIFAIPFLGLTYLVFNVARSSKSLSCVTHLNPRMLHANFIGGREIKSVSAEECDRLLRTTSDLILIEIRSKIEKAAFEPNLSEALLMSPRQFLELMMWLPETSSVVVFATSDFFSSNAWLLCGIHGTAPIYLLRSKSFTFQNLGIKSK